MKAENFGEYYLALDNALHIKKINDIYTEITGYDMEDVMEGNHTLAQLTEEEDYPMLREQIISVLGNGETQLVRHRIRTKDQDVRNVMSVISLHREGHKLSALHCFLLKDSSEGRRVTLPEKANTDSTLTESGQKQLEHSTRDNLTGLLSHSMMSLMVNQYLRSEREDRAHAFLLLDIDNLKEVNDRMGYFFGDTVLENLADILREVFTGNTLIGRVEGDKFAVLVQDTNAKEVIELAEQACWQIRESYVGEDERLRIRVRIGIAVYPFNGTDFKKLFHDAAMAVYQLKMEKKTDAWLFYEDEELMTGETKTVRTGHTEQPGKSAAVSETGDSDAGTGTASDRVVELRRVGLFDTDLVMFAFDVLSSGKDITSSMKILMERIGKQYDLDRIVVLSGQNRSWPLHLSCCWEAQQTEKFLPKLPNSYEWADWEELLEQGESFGFHSVDSMASAKTPLAKRLLNELQARSMAACGAYRMKEFCGCVLFLDYETPRNWNSTVKETFLQLGKMMAYFLWLREENEAAEKRIEKLTDYDRITGLYNMERFKREADRLLTGNHSRNYAVAYCDLSNFAYINESYGYEKGDALLYSFARSVVRENSKCLVASRMFSDCFTLLLEYDSKNDLLERVQERIERFEQEQKEFYPNADIHVVAGIYMCAEGVGITEAMDNANIARKSIKGNRKAVCQIYRPEQWVSGKNEFIALGTLQTAMEQHHLVVYLQPKVSLQNGKVTGAEALIRWFNPDGTMKYPDEFIPGLERTGSIVDLDFYVYEQVLSQLRKWLDEGKPVVPVSVNLSRKHGYYGDFAERILDLTLKYQIPHELIEFEVTEGAFMETEENLVTRLEILRNAGFRISMDDFGVGYSSLSMMINAPIDSVKIDKSFLYHSETEPERQSLIKYIIDMAHTLHKEIICEGVETAQQAEFLRKCSCETAQGYLFSKPITMPDFEELYLARK